MGIVKQMWLEEMERGFGRLEGHICSECVDDEWLKQWVTDNTTSKQCSFCESDSQDEIAAGFEEFLGQVMNGILFGWNHPDYEGIMYVSAEGGYQASISDNVDVVWDLGISENDSVIEALISNIDDSGWVARDYYSGTASDILGYGWNNFKDVIKHKSRFFFLSPSEDEKYYGPEIPPSVMLDAIADVIRTQLSEFELIRPISAGTDLVRLRIERDSEHSTAAEVGTPPAEYANRSNRMSPAGIPMFYGAFNFETAFAEAFDPENDAGAIVSAATFRPIRALQVLDLANLPDTPSIYDDDRNHLIHPLRFLHSFADDISKPIKRDGKEHIEYVPTQIVTEYFRKIFEIEGQRIDGISYRSSKANSEVAFVLFFENEHCFDGEPVGREQEVLQLISVSHSIATRDPT